MVHGRTLPPHSALEQGLEARAKNVSEVDELAGKDVTQFCWALGDSVGQVRTYSQLLKYFFKSKPRV